MASMTMDASAEFSIDGKHRLRLDRWWAPGPRAVVCMANPSKAGAHDNDATVWNLIALVRAIRAPKHPAARGVHRLVPGTTPIVWRPAKQVAA
jgi:hypothetical protein